MSNGTRVYTVRLSDELMEQVQETMARRDHYAFESPWSLSDFIRIAVQEKLSKMERSRRSKKGKVKGGSTGQEGATDSECAPGEDRGEPVLSAGEGQRRPEATMLVQPGKCGDGSSGGVEHAPPQVDLSSM